MNVTESCDVQTLLDFLLNRRGVSGSAVAGSVAMECACRLADRAHKTLVAGPDGKEVRALWTTSAPLPSLARPRLRRKDKSR